MGFNKQQLPFCLSTSQIIRFRSLLLVTCLLFTSQNLFGHIFKVLHNFSLGTRGSGSYIVNSDGADLYLTGVLLAGNRLYGTTYNGGTNAAGVVYSLDTNGNNFTVLHTFSRSTGSPTYDGQSPVGGLLLAGDTLYGTALYGGTVPAASGTGGYGTLYSIKTNGSNFTRLHSFNDVPDGRHPHGPLVLSHGKLYGVAESGGTGNKGTIFSISTNGTGFTVLHALTNTEGSLPYAGLLLKGDSLYGSAHYGGSSSNGTLFSISTNGNNFNVIHTFGPSPAPYYTNYDGRNCESRLVSADGKLFGTAVAGGLYYGTLFSLNQDGSDFTVLHRFTGGLDGRWAGSLLAVEKMIYGVAYSGGVYNKGVIYAIRTDGSDFTVLHDIMPPGPHHNGDPQALILSGNTLYGTTEFGGTHNNGTVFSLTITPSISGITLVGADLVINARNGVPGQTCYLLTSTNAVSPLVNWTTIATNVLTGGSFSITATNAMNLGTSQQFYAIKVQ